MTARAPLAPDDPRHGTTNGYVNLDCRCVRCRGAWATWMRKQRARNTPLAPDDPRHGTDNAYLNRGCRCDRCTAAHSATRRASRAREERNAARTAALNPDKGAS